MSETKAIKFLKCDSCGLLLKQEQYADFPEKWSKICFSFMKRDNRLLYSQSANHASAYYDICPKCSKKIQFIVGDTMRVLGPRAIVQRVDPPKPKSSIIEVVELEPDPSQFGVVIEVGSIPDLKKGDAVIVKKFSGSPIRHKIKGEEVEVFVMMEDDILATMG